MTAHGRRTRIAADFRPLLLVLALMVASDTTRAATKDIRLTSDARLHGALAADHLTIARGVIITVDGDLTVTANHIQIDGVLLAAPAASAQSGVDLTLTSGTDIVVNGRIVGGAGFQGGSGHVTRGVSAQHNPIDGFALAGQGGTSGALYGIARPTDEGARRRYPA